MRSCFSEAMFYISSVPEFCSAISYSIRGYTLISGLGKNQCRVRTNSGLYKHILFELFDLQQVSGIFLNDVFACDYWDLQGIHLPRQTI